MENVDLFPEIEITHVYVDGGVCGKNPSDFGGSWGFIAVNANDEKVFAKSGFHQTEGQPTTNNHTELVAVIQALEHMPSGWSGTICSDSLCTLGRVFSGWKMKNVPHDYIVRLDKAKKRVGKIKGQHVKGHVTKAELAAGISKKGYAVSKWNIEVDALCTMENNKVKGKIK